MNTIRRLLAVSALVAAAAGPASAQSHARLMHGTHSFALAARDASGAAGRVSLTARDAVHTVVTVQVAGVSRAVTELRLGPCAGGRPFAPLTALANGVSTTTVHFSIDKLTAGYFSVDVKGPAGTLACGALGHRNVIGAR